MLRYIGMAAALLVFGGSSVLAAEPKVPTLLLPVNAPQDMRCFQITGTTNFLGLQLPKGTTTWQPPSQLVSRLKTDSGRTITIEGRPYPIHLTEVKCVRAK